MMPYPKTEFTDFYRWPWQLGTRCPGSFDFPVPEKRTTFGHTDPVPKLMMAAQFKKSRTIKPNEDINPLSNTNQSTPIPLIRKPRPRPPLAKRSSPPKLRSTRPPSRSGTPSSTSAIETFHVIPTSDTASRLVHSLTFRGLLVHIAEWALAQGWIPREHEENAEINVPESYVRINESLRDYLEGGLGFVPVNEKEVYLIE
ncbi:hypothetical protein BC936DRAFT_144039 [Jimgerdemannia flammicorona]|uniref:Uncharacterized protein n=1 Tax=Jimgerdemannia flammicorona TaxID=994334 RepID=A0A433DNN8_9FUNG|nr:hypothetical protein BC936DRAFT_144039 [Jimgerdemannia flammicorona]